MVTYPSAIHAERHVTRGKAWLFLLLCAAWLLPGLTGHDPWKPDEAEVFGAAYHILQGGGWLVPTLAGEPFLENPPLYYLSAALFAKAFAAVLPLHDGARLASGFYMALALLFLGLSARELLGKGQGWIAVMVLIGCLGLLVRAHQLIPDTALLAAMAMALHGIALAPRRPLPAGLLLGTGTGIGFMAKGILAPATVGPAALLLLLFSAWRTRGYALCLLVGVIAAAPWLIVWPAALYHRAPELFSEWLWTYNLGHLPGFAPDGASGQTLHLLKTLAWFAWPALPVALWALWVGGLRGLNRPGIQLPLVFFLVVFALLSFKPDTKELELLPVLLPLSLLAAAGLDTLRRGAASALDWFGIMTFGLMAGVIWLGWLSLLTGHPAYFARHSKYFRLGTPIEFDAMAFVLAIVVTVLWIALVWRIGRSNRRAVINWAGGVTLIWMLSVTLALHWVDSFKSYRSMVASFMQSLPATHQCVASRGLGESQRALLHYFGGIVTQRQEAGRGGECDLLLVQGKSKGDVAPPGNRWNKIWEGGRPGDKTERFRLYQRLGP